MCRALKVLCVAPDREALTALKRAAVSADWELTPGATDEANALAQIDEEHPHVVAVWGDFGRFVAEARRRLPYVRIVTDRDVPQASDVVADLTDLRDAIKGLPRPRGPVT
ncbi:MAG TPA: hypothetical protein VHM47_03875 [Actinomycetota bacterium]|jgi:hypothetical protein|nr:hypothetical protein [Actinomycetota bacterium]